MDLTYLRENSDVVWQRTLEHLQLSLTALVLALPIALLLGTLAVRFRQLQFPILTTLGVAYTVPSLVILVFLIPSQGIGNRPILITLVMYAQFFLVRNIVAGLRGVSPAALEAARGVGMTGFQVFRLVWFPLALPVVIAGVRAALLTIIGLAVFGGLISAGGLGRILFEGIGRNYPSMVLAGIIAIVALSATVDLVLRLLERTTPLARSIRSS
ncbi:MAG: ABC transporter permease [Chloroflexota bacterium]|nr:ABC transporter permease [Chloroflexia bacterium]MDQ3443798.1 ABC transporter permease [Chloroflexota bacterium]